jgi:hypothetical protein
VRPIVSVIGGDPGEQVLKVLAGHQVAIRQGGAAKFGQQGIAGTIDTNLVTTRHLNCI